MIKEVPLGENEPKSSQAFKSALDPNLTQDERHRIIQEKRQKRKDEAKLKEELSRERK